MSDAVRPLRGRRFPTGIASTVYATATLLGTALGQAELGAQEAEGPDRITLQGEVVDASTNLPLEGAIVSLPGPELTAVTDSLGYYRIEEVPAGTHAVRVFRLGYEEFVAEVPVSGEEILALYLTPGPIPLEGIEVVVLGDSELDWRPVGRSRRAFIGPGEIEDLRDMYQSLDHILRVRRLPQVRYIPPVQPGGTGSPDSNGCLRLVTQLGTNLCAMVVMDGIPIDKVSAGWMYQTSSHDVYSVRFLGGVEGFHRYGARGANGVLEINTHHR